MKTLRELTDIVQRLANEGSTQSKLGSWTMAQLCGHLAKTVEASCPGGDFGPRGLPRWVRPLVKRLILWTRYMPSSATAPTPLVPDEDVSTDDAIARLVRTVQTFEDLPDESRSQMTPSPAFGSMTYDDWRRMHLIHAAHHLKVFTGKRC